MSPARAPVNSQSVTVTGSLRVDDRRFSDQKHFIITIITKITWATRLVLSVDEKSTPVRECITVAA